MNDPGQSSRASSESGESVIRVDSVDELRDVIAQPGKVLLVGNRTKKPLSTVPSEVKLISTNRLSGITEYEPSEFTFTAKAGTTIAELNAVLAEKHQYLPFDPLLVDQHATIGGTVAAGLSGPGRHRYGGIRDFILGADFIAGDGESIRSGGKVVKNAAGFDLPKLLVGSCGRLAAMTQLTFKVFPSAPEYHSYRIEAPSHEQAVRTIALLARGRWELDAIDYRTADRSVWVRIGGSASVSEAIAADIAATIDKPPLAPVAGESARRFWSEVNGLSFGEPPHWFAAKVPTNLATTLQLAQWCDEQGDCVVMHSSVAGAVCWLSICQQSLPQLDQFLKTIDRYGLLILGDVATDAEIRIGSRPDGPLQQAVKDAMDPPGRFPSFPG